MDAMVMLAGVTLLVCHILSTWRWCTPTITTHHISSHALIHLRCNIHSTLAPYMSPSHTCTHVPPHTCSLLTHGPRRNMEKCTLLEHMDALFLVLEELVDGG